MKFTLIGCLAFFSFSLFAQKNIPMIGIVQDYENDSLIHASGYKFLIESISKCFSPIKLTDQQFEEKLSAIKNLKTPLFAADRKSTRLNSSHQ